MKKSKDIRYMKTLNKIVMLLIASLAFLSCTRSFEAPPLNEPKYEGKANITVAQLKEKYANVADVQEIEFDYVLQVKVTANDKSGNIFKQIYVADETGGINLGLDQNSMYTMFGVGQEVFIELHGLYMVKYGGEFQIAYKGTQANRIPWALAIENHLFPNGWPTHKVEPIVKTMDKLTDSDVNSFVRINGVYFQNGGKKTFAPEENYGEEYIKDAKGNSIMVRTSSYANFANKTLPEGYGDVQGVLGRFNGNWQLAIREYETDIINFGGDTPTPEPEPTDAFYKETFGTEDAGARPKIAEYKGYDVKNVTYSDESGRADVRVLGGNNHVWLPANSTASLKIEGINTAGGQDLVLSYKLAANLYDDGASTDLNVITIVVDGIERQIESIPVSKDAGDNNNFKTISLKDIPAKENLTIEFKSTTANDKGMRLDDIVIQKKDESIIITPEKPGGGTVDPDPDPDPTPGADLFYEGFTKLAPSNPSTQIKDFAAEYKQYADGAKAHIEYEVSYQSGMLRNTSKIDGHIWFGATHTNSFKIKNVDTSAGKNLILTFKLAANGEQDLSAIKVSINGQVKDLPSTPALDANAFSDFTLENIPATKSLELEFSVEGEKNKAGIRLDDIRIAEKK